jgi:hypothetical protein
MAKRRKAAPVSLTASQRERLESKWFYYGNYGPQTTPGNHQFIQGLLEHGLDLRPLRTRRTPKSEIPTAECEAAVDRILKDPEGLDYEPPARRLLRLVTTPPQTRPCIRPVPEIKSMLDDMRRRQNSNIRSYDDAPDAA